jgi:hypothetical protein
MSHAIHPYNIVLVIRESPDDVRLSFDLRTEFNEDDAHEECGTPIDYVDLAVPPLLFARYLRDLDLYALAKNVALARGLDN